MEKLDKDALLKVLPAKCTNTLTDAVIQHVNDMISKDHKLAESYSQNIMGYVGVLQDGKFKLDDYLNAVRYVTYKLMGDNNTIAYTKTFPQRYAKLVAQQATPKDISAYASNYNKNKLVNLIFAQTLIPVHVINADLHQEAINVQAKLMRSAKSEKVRSDAANSLITALKPPEEAKIKLDIGTQDTDAIKELKDATLALALQQKQLIEAGHSNAKEVAESKIISNQ